MKILFYNWVDYLDDENRGGGVSVYQHNLIHALDDEGNNDCYFLSSGISYDMFSTAPRWARIKHGPNEGRRRRFEIINSGVLAPAHHSFGKDTQLEHPDTTKVFFDFIRKHGPFDVVHFNNLEGLPAEVLALKEHWPDTRVVFSLHNYYPICPQVNLWHQERENCLDFDGGRKCEHCLPLQHDDRIIRLANAVAFSLKKRGVRPGSKLFDRGFGPSMRVAGRLVKVYKGRFSREAAPVKKDNKLLQRVELGHHKYARRRERMVSLINTHCDTVLCVSGRVAQVAERFGIAATLLQTSYIGTRHAEKFEQTSPPAEIIKADGTLTLAYLGYMRHDKGFFFLLDALESLPSKSAKRVNVVIASRLIDQPTMDRILQLSETLASVQFADGYSHDQLDDLLDDVDLGLVPVLWEDNLPQVAIEMHARHIPLLTSNLGGAQELGNCPDLVYTAGDTKDFALKIANVLDGKVDMKSYWKSAMAPHSMADHLSELHQVYDAPVRAIELAALAVPKNKGTLT
ncbi:MAG: glycosyltransferase involved in cell wall biosynthesis [Paracoccaceae bacterium]|jgi:glycosyltransferase involved in cell wall biosynthesis